ncbi:hypothetical protein LTR66_005691 [Elasticomyces elasticus]|nr:hypothetical protein LTR66_005691 [Elasticomyces elasticus]
MHFSHFPVAVFADPRVRRRDYTGILLSTGRTLFNKVWSLLTNYGSVVFHLLADPEDTLWSLLTKLDLARRCEQWAYGRLRGFSEKDQRHIAIVCFALDDQDFGRTTGGSETQQLTHAGALVHCLNDPAIRQTKEWTALMAACRQAGILLSQTRSQNARRSALAIIFYASALFISLASSKSSNTMQAHMPHTIALRELYYWLIPAITLSAAVGAFPTPWTAYAILQPVARTIRACGVEFELAALKPWSGGNYVWRPQKNLSKVFPTDDDCGFCASLRSLRLFSLSFLSVAIAWAMSFTVSWYTPTVGLGCRNITELSYFIIWTLSCLLTHVFGIIWNKPQDVKRLFVVVYIKDAFLAIPMVTILFAAFRDGGTRVFATRHTGLSASVTLESQ